MRQVGIDTNVLLRLFVEDDPVQRETVLRFGSRLNKDYKGTVTLVSLLEFDWALRSQYRYSRAESLEAVKRLVRIRGIEVECHDVVVKALTNVESRNTDFADALIAFRSQDLGCASVFTLDEKAAARIPGMELLA
jgi:predicted nucleic-acid-binding protein